MVKVFAPLFSGDAQGSLGDALTFKKVRITNYVSRKNPPFRICIDNRTFWQRNHVLTVETWHELTDYWHGAWGRWAEWNMPLWSGFNSFYHHYMTALAVGDTPNWWPPG